LPFKKKEKVTDSATLSGAVLDPPKIPTVKALQLKCGKARARVEMFAGALEIAQAEFATISRESVADETLDVAAVGAALNQAKAKTEDMERALTVATRRLDEAERELKDAEYRLLVEAETDVLKRLYTVAVHGDHILSGLESWVRDELTPSLTAAYAATATCGRSQAQTAFLHSFRQAVVLCVNRACYPFIPDGRAQLSAFKDRPLSSWLSPDQFPKGTTQE
jgi:hypothetical protein